MEVVLPEALSLLDDPEHIKGNRLANYQMADSSTYAPGGKIRIRIPGDAASLSDFRSHLFSFQIVPTSTASTYLRMTQSIASIIQQLNVYIGSNQIEQYTNYNILHNAWNTRNEADWFQAGDGVATAGYGTVAQRTAWAAEAGGHCYGIQLMAGLLRDVAPTSFMNEQIWVEMILAAPEAVIVTDGTSPTYTVSNLKFHYHNLVPEIGFMSSLKDKIFSGDGLLKGYESAESYVSSGLTGTSVNQVLPFRYNNFKGVIAVILNTDKLTSMAGAVSPASGAGDTKTVDFVFATAKDYQMQVNITQYPLTPVVCVSGVEPYRMYKEVTYTHRPHKPPYAAFNYAVSQAYWIPTPGATGTVELFPPSTSYVHGILVTPYPRSGETERHVFDGVKTSDGSSTIQWKSTFNGSINAGMTGTAQYNWYGIFEYGIVYKGGAAIVRK